MSFIDIHCHLDFYKDKEIKEIIKNAKRKNVNIIVFNGVNLKSNKKVLSLSRDYPEIKASLGLYPKDAINLNKNQINNEIKFIKENKNKIIAIGEIGLDLKEIETLNKQEKIFIKLLTLSKEIDKPVIIHSRKAEKQVIKILESKNMKKVIMHCFCGKKKLVKKIVENNWFLSIPANVKYSEQFQEIIKITPLKNLFCETDSPFLHPEKKFPNEPKNVIESYKKISEIKNLKLEEVEKIIEENYRRLFS
jgi:TatD DNase family protein